MIPFYCRSLTNLSCSRSISVFSGTSTCTRRLLIGGNGARLFRSAINRARGTGGGFLGASPVTISSGSSLGKNIFVTPPPTTSRRSDISDENFFSAGSSDSARSSYYSHSSITGGPRTTTGLASMTPVTSATSETQLPSTFTPSTFASSALTPSYGFTEVSSTHSAGSDVSFADSPSTLSRAREIRRRMCLVQSRRGTMRIVRATKVDRPVGRSRLAVCIVR